jgi:acylphosphatase
MASDGGAQPTARAVVVHGDVQGVFYRGSCRAEAESRGVVGWARNEYDGTVRAHFEGPAEAVEAMVEWARHGPRHAHVQQVDVHEVEPEGGTRFEVR